MSFFGFFKPKTQKHPVSALYDKFIKQFVLENSKNYSEIDNLENALPHELIQVLKHNALTPLYKYNLFLLLYKTYIPILWEGKTDIIIGTTPTEAPPSTTAGLYFTKIINTKSKYGEHIKISFNVGTDNFELRVDIFTSHPYKYMYNVNVQYNTTDIDDYFKRVWGTNMPSMFSTWYRLTCGNYYHDKKDVFECINNHLKYFFYLCVKNNVFPENINDVAIKNLIEEYNGIIEKIKAEVPALAPAEVEAPAEAKQFWTEYYLSTSIMQKLIQTEKIQTILQRIRTNNSTNTSYTITLSPFTQSLYNLHNAMIDIDRPPETNPIEYIQIMNMNPEIAGGGKIKTYKYQKGAGKGATGVTGVTGVTTAYEAANKHKAQNPLTIATTALNAATEFVAKVVVAKDIVAKDAIAAAKFAIAKVATTAKVDDAKIAKDTATVKVDAAKFDAAIKYITYLGKKVETFKTVEALQTVKELEAFKKELEAALEANSEAYTEEDMKIINDSLSSDNTDLVLEAALIYYYHIQFTHSENTQPPVVTYAVDKTTFNDFVKAIRAFKNAKYAVKTALINTIVEEAQVQEVSGKSLLNFIFLFPGNNIEYELTQNVQEGSGSNKYQILYYKYVVQRKQAS